MRVCMTSHIIQSVIVCMIQSNPMLITADDYQGHTGADGADLCQKLVRQLMRFGMRWQDSTENVCVLRDLKLNDLLSCDVVWINSNVQAVHRSVILKEGSDKI